MTVQTEFARRSPIRNMESHIHGGLGKGHIGVMASPKIYVNGKLDMARTPYGLDFSRIRTYADSKLCNMLFTLELARRLHEEAKLI